MGKRRRTPATARKSSADGTNSQPLSLLCLPLEIRCMIWKAVVTTSGPIDLIASSLTNSIPAKASKVRFTLPPPPKNDKKRKPRVPHKRRPASDSLNWLRTNRQIYAEARPIVYSNVSLHIVDVLCMSAFLSQTPRTRIKPPMIQSLSLDLTLGINADVRDKSYSRYSDFCDGFFFAKYLDHHGWENAPCSCPNCFAASNIILANAAEHLTALRELRLRIAIICTNGPANERSMMNLVGPWGRRQGKLYRPSNPDPLVCKDNSEQIADHVKWVCTRAPLRIISKVKLDAVDVRFSVEKIEHQSSLTHRGGIQCWCKTWTVDKESIENCGIAEEIRRQLMSEDPKEESS